MVHIPEHTIEAIKKESNIVDTVSQYVQLKKSGKNHFAQCPFHEDRTPSFSVSEDKQIFHCFSCGRGGDVFGFLREIEGYSFPQAVINQAERIGYNLDDELKAQLKRDKPRADSDFSLLLTIHRLAADFYHHVLLNTRAGESALEYLQGRGLTLETIKAFQLGCAPGQQREALAAYLMTQEPILKEKKSLLAQSGLFSDYALENNDKLIDRFSQRIIFPLADERGQVVAFSGRIFSEHNAQSDRQTAKYLNSPETKIFNKRQMLYNLNQAKGAARREQEIILVEGYMDVIAAAQAGVSHCVASMGTSLTEEQLEKIDRYAQKIVLAYDGDQAGLDATKRAIDLIQSETPFDIEVVIFPSGEDPDNYIQNHSAQSFRNLMSHGRETVMTFYMHYYQVGVNLDNEREQLIYINQVMKELAHIQSPVERELYLKQLSETFHISVDSLIKQFNQIKEQVNQERLSELKDQRQAIEKNLQDQSFQMTEQKTLSRSEKAEQMLLHRLLYSDDAWDYLTLHYPDFKFIHSNYQLIYYLYGAFREKGYTSPDLFLSELDSQTAGLVSEIMLIDLGDDFSEQELVDYIDQISVNDPLERQLNDLLMQLDEAKRTGDRSLEQELTIHITHVVKDIHKNKSKTTDNLGGN